MAYFKDGRQRVCSSLFQPFWNRRKYTRLILPRFFSTIKSVYYVNHNTLTKRLVFEEMNDETCVTKSAYSHRQTKEERINQMKMFHAVYMRLGVSFFCCQKADLRNFSPAKLMSCGICKKESFVFLHTYFFLSSSAPLTEFFMSWICEWHSKKRELLFYRLAKSENFLERKPHKLWKLLNLFSSCLCVRSYAYFYEHTFFMYVQLLMMINGRKGTLLERWRLQCCFLCSVHVRW